MHRLLERLAHWFEREWDREADTRLRAKAEQYALRAEMDGDVVKRTGEVIPREVA